MLNVKKSDMLVAQIAPCGRFFRFWKRKKPFETKGYVQKGKGAIQRLPATLNSALPAKRQKGLRGNGINALKTKGYEMLKTAKAK